MENAIYTTLARQSGLTREMNVLANNIANANTTGFRQAGVTFTEFVKASSGAASLSMAVANVPSISTAQGTLTQTGGAFDFAIEGDGYFMIETPAGNRLTRAGSFAPNGAGNLVTAQGYLVMDSGGAAIFIPPDAGTLGVSADGTISAEVLQENDAAAKVLTRSGFRYLGEGEAHSVARGGYLGELVGQRRGKSGRHRAPRPSIRASQPVTSRQRRASAGLQISPLAISGSDVPLRASAIWSQWAGGR